MSNPSKSVSKLELLDKYKSGDWEERLHQFDLEVKEVLFGKPFSETATVRKRTEIYREKHTNKIRLSRHIFESADRSIRVNITYMVDDDGTEYCAVRD